MTHDNGMDVSPSWQDLKAENKELRKIIARLGAENRELMAERDALAAHVEALKPALEDFVQGHGVCCCGDDMKTHTIDEHSPVDSGWYALDQHMGQTPSTSLARRDARMKAEAMESLASSSLVGEMHKELVRRCAEEYRRQASGDDS